MRSSRVRPLMRRVFRSSAKNGPDRTRPNSSTSSFISVRERHERPSRVGPRWRTRACADVRASRTRRVLVPGACATPCSTARRARNRSAIRARIFSTKAPITGV